jgi:hypothetical protein
MAVLVQLVLLGLRARLVALALLVPPGRLALLALDQLFLVLQGLLAQLALQVLPALPRLLLGLQGLLAPQA